jgi:hypothetical protein
MSMKAMRRLVSSAPIPAMSRSNSGLSGEAIEDPGELQIGSDILLPGTREGRIQTPRVHPQGSENAQRVLIAERSLASRVLAL